MIERTYRVPFGGHLEFPDWAVADALMQRQINDGVPYADPVASWSIGGDPHGWLITLCW